ncbi:MAG TPA: ABC transporter ATP-binding protein [Opitutaceae bacterium]|nr:ABC transporter ATP-binding protein [Opitutaceae bacterium]
MSRLVLKTLSKRYSAARRPVVEEVSFVVETGTVTALVGESGAGKSTLLRLIAGLESPDTGEIYLGERLLSSPAGIVPPEKRGVGLVFQNHALFPHLTVGENIGFGLKGRSKSETRAEIARLLTLVRLSGSEQRMPNELSGGERQRIALARTLAPRPGLILLDEPFSSLDTELKARVRDDVRTILREAGVTALLVTHDAADALDLADQIAVMRHGRLLQVSSPTLLHASPANREVASFFGACNFFPQRVFAQLNSSEWKGLYRPSGKDEVWIRPGHLQVVSAETARQQGGIVGTLLSWRFHGPYWEVRLQPDDASIPVAVVHIHDVQPEPKMGRAGLLPVPLSKVLSSS